jgi:beta-lactamase superfamily II metal-dependent hydrolase
VDVFILSHHDDDHIKGFQQHFHVGNIADYKDDSDLIYIKEIWGSSRFFKRASNYNTLKDDAKAFNTEMRRRYNLHKDNKAIQVEGNRIIILGESEDDKTDHVEDIVYKMGETIKKLNNKDMSSKIEIELLGPIEQQEGEEDKLYQRANRGSVVLQVNIKEGGNTTNQILLTGDAGADVLEYMHDIYPLSSFEYDILQAPHHCSKYSMFNKIEDDKCELSEKAHTMLSQANRGAKIIASCREFGKKPPHKEAREEYEKIVGETNFLYTAGHKKNKKVEPIEFELTKEGHKKPVGLTKSKVAAAAGTSAGEARGHG